MNTKVATILFVSVIIGLGSASAQDVWLGETGNWSNAASWSTGIVPNSSTVDVRIDNGNPVVSVVSFDLTSGSVGKLTLDGRDTLYVWVLGSLAIYTSADISGEIYSWGAITNSGTINNSGYFGGKGSFNNEVFSTVSNNGYFGPGYILNSGTIDSHGPLSNAWGLDNYGALYSTGYFDNGDLLNNSGLFNSSGKINNHADIINSATFNNSGNILNYTDINNSGTLTNSGRIDIYHFISSRINNSGTLINLNSGTLNNDGIISNYSGGTLNNYGWLYNRRSGTLNNNGLFNNDGTVSNAGAVVIASGATLANTGTYSQSVGSTRVDGLFSSSTAIQINGGTLSGSGVIQGDVMIGGTLLPGDSPGKLTIDGNYTQLAAGTFFAEIAGLAPGAQYDQLIVHGNVNLDGNLYVDLLGNYNPALGSTYVILLFTPGGLNGMFTDISHTALNGNAEYFRPIYDNTDGIVELEVAPVPEPASFLLLGSRLLGIAGMLRHKLFR